MTEISLPDSYCVTRWSAPAQLDLKWKKSTLGKSLQNLREIKDFLAQESHYLECFRLLSQKKLEQKFPEQKLRQGDYVLLADLKAEKIYVEVSGSTKNLTPIGGGREEGETSLEGLKRETLEETKGQLELDKNKLIPICETEFLENFGEFKGKKASFYFYPLEYNSIEGWQEYDEWKSKKWEKEVYNDLGWMDLREFILGNKYINYFTWENFCLKNNLPCFPLSPEKTREHSLQYFYRQESLDFYFKEGTSFWEQKVKTWLQEGGKSVGDYLWPLRVALSGRIQSPSPFELLAILSQEEVQERLRLCLEEGEKAEIS